MNAPEASINPPKVSLPEKYSGAAARIGATIVIQPEPAVTHVSLVTPVTILRIASSTAARSMRICRASSASPPESEMASR